MSRGCSGALLAALFAPLLAGCAATAPATSSATTSTSGARPAPAGPGPAALRVSIVPADSLPSEDALNVLKTIPEPLAPGEVVPPPESGATPNPADTTGVAADSTAIVPIPTPTAPLGEGPGSAAQSSLADSLARAAAAHGPSAASGGTAGAAGAAAAAGTAGAAGASMAGTAPGAGATSATRDTCWRVQVAAPTDRDEAEAMRSAAESQLLVSMTVVADGQRFKVQTRDCLTSESSDAIRARALSAGFDGAFRTRTVSEPPASSTAKPKSAPPAKPPGKPSSNIGKSDR